MWMRTDASREWSCSDACSDRFARQESVVPVLKPGFYTKLVELQEFGGDGCGGWYGGGGGKAAA